MSYQSCKHTTINQLHRSSNCTIFFSQSPTIFPSFASTALSVLLLSSSSARPAIRAFSSAFSFSSVLSFLVYFMTPPFLYTLTLPSTYALIISLSNVHLVASVAPLSSIRSPFCIFHLPLSSLSPFFAV